MSDLKKIQGWDIANESFAGVERLKPVTTEATITKSYAGMAALQPTPLASVTTNPIYPTAQGSTTNNTTSINPNPSPNPVQNRNR